METTQTFSIFGPATVEALFDELEKIAEEAKPTDKPPKFENWIKNTALIAGGSGLGVAGAMAVDKIVGAKIGPLWQRMSPATKKKIVGGLIGATTVGSTLAARKLMDTRYQKDRE